MGEKILLINCDLSRQRMLETRAFELELHQQFLSLRMIFKAEEPDPEDDALPWIEVDNDFEVLVPKVQFAGLEKVWLQKDRRWKIAIHMNGLPAELKMFFKKGADCQPVYEKLKQYFFPIDK
jgi:hypothetical protein